MKTRLLIALITTSVLVFTQNASASDNCQELIKTFIRKSEAKPATAAKPVTSKPTKPVEKAPAKPVAQPTKPVVKPVTPVKQPEVVYAKVNVKQKLDVRLEYGEISKRDYETFLKVTDEFESKNKAPLMGEGMEVCFVEFSPEAAESLVKLVNKTQGSRNSEDTFNRLVKGSQEIFGDTNTQAKTKICALSKGNNCKLFSQAIGRHCP